VQVKLNTNNYTISQIATTNSKQEITASVPMFRHQTVSAHFAQSNVAATKIAGCSKEEPARYTGITKISHYFWETVCTRRPASADRTARRQFQATDQPVTRTQASDAMTARRCRAMRRQKERPGGGRVLTQPVGLEWRPR